MTIELTQEQEQLIEQELATGHFSDKGEVIAEALVLLKRQGEGKGEGAGRSAAGSRQSGRGALPDDPQPRRRPSVLYRA